MIFGSKAMATVGRRLGVGGAELCDELVVVILSYACTTTPAVMLVCKHWAQLCRSQLSIRIPLLQRPRTLCSLWFGCVERLEPKNVSEVVNNLHTISAVCKWYSDCCFSRSILSMLADYVKCNVGTQILQQVLPVVQTALAGLGQTNHTHHARLILLNAVSSGNLPALKLLRSGLPDWHNFVRGSILVENAAEERQVETVCWLLSEFPHEVSTALGTIWQSNPLNGPVASAVFCLYKDAVNLADLAESTPTIQHLDLLLDVYGKEEVVVALRPHMVQVLECAIQNKDVQMVEKLLNLACKMDVNMITKAIDNTIPESNSILQCFSQYFRYMSEATKAKLIRDYVGVQNDDALDVVVQGTKDGYSLVRVIMEEARERQEWAEYGWCVHFLQARGKHTCMARCHCKW